MYFDYQHELPACLSRCSSGQELIAGNAAEDVLLAAALNVSAAAPRLRDGAFCASAGGAAPGPASGAAQQA